MDDLVGHGLASPEHVEDHQQLHLRYGWMQSLDGLEDSPVEGQSGLEGSVPEVACLCRAAETQRDPVGKLRAGHAVTWSSGGNQAAARAIAYSQQVLATRNACCLEEATVRSQEDRPQAEVISHDCSLGRPVQAEDNGRNSKHDLF